MNRASPLPLVIVGGGLSGSLAALALARRRPDQPLLLLELGSVFGGNHIWSFFDSDVEPALRPQADALDPVRWPDHDIRFPARRRRLAIGYNSVRSANLDRLVRAQLSPDSYRLDCAIVDVAADHVLLDDGERIDAIGVIDARGPGPGPVAGLDLAWQKFVGRTYDFPDGHGQQRPVIMDATVDQADGYRFVYTLPFTATEMLVEDTYYSTSPALDIAAIGRNADAYAATFGPARLRSEETGLLPVLLGGDVGALWDRSPAALLGLRGGFFHPTTGYSLPDALRNAELVAAMPDLSTGALRARLRSEAERLWKDRHFFQLLNRMLFHAAEPRDRYRVLEHFYRLPEPLVERFYAARLTLFDKARIVSGRPPVPVSGALKALVGKAA